MKPLIELKNIRKTYFLGEIDVPVLKGISLEIGSGEYVALMGASGSGKSTLMNMIGALDRPTEGTYLLNGQDISKMTDEQLSDIRNQQIGFVFQNFCLIPRMSAVRNVEIPLRYANLPAKKRRERAMELLDLVGMSERANHKPNELSGGQNQRVAIARAMANDPEILLADEPTGALDSKTGHLVMDIFHRLHREQHKTIILITHSQELAQETQRMITISDGMILSDRQKTGGEPV